MDSLPTIGEKISLYYPKVNRVDVAPELRFLRIQVDGIRDLSLCPLSIEEFLANPFERYGRYQVQGIDLEHASYPDKSMSRITAYLDWHQPHDIQLGFVGSSGGSDPRYHFLYNATHPDLGNRKFLVREYFRKNSLHQKHLRELQGTGVVAGIFVAPRPTVYVFDEPIRLAEQAVRETARTKRRTPAKRSNSKR